MFLFIVFFTLNTQCTYAGTWEQFNQAENAKGETVQKKQLKDHPEVLTELSLAINELQLLPKNLSVLKKLKKLAIAPDCKSDKSSFPIPEGIDRLASLETLEIGVSLKGYGRQDCSLETTLPSSIGNLTSLKVLSIDDALGKQPKLPGELSRLQKLEGLRLSRTKLTAVPPFINSLKQLKVLNLSSNGLKELPDSLANLSELTEINLDFNDFIDLPPFLTRLVKLKQISLGNNCKITQSKEKRSNLQKRFPAITFNFEDEFDCQ